MANVLIEKKRKGLEMKKNKLGVRVAIDFPTKNTVTVLHLGDMVSPGTR
jgi:hypothetical protein